MLYLLYLPHLTHNWLEGTKPVVCLLCRWQVKEPLVVHGPQVGEAGWIAVFLAELVVCFVFLV